MHQSPQASISDSMRGLRFLLVQLCPQKTVGQGKDTYGKEVLTIFLWLSTTEPGPQRAFD